MCVCGKLKTANAKFKRISRRESFLDLSFRIFEFDQKSNNLPDLQHIITYYITNVLYY